MNSKLLFSTVLLSSLILTGCGPSSIVPPNYDDPSVDKEDLLSFAFENNKELSTLIDSFTPNADGSITSENIASVLNICGSNDYVVNSASISSFSYNKILNESREHTLDNFDNTDTKSIKRYQNEDNSILLVSGTINSDHKSYVDSDLTDSIITPVMSESILSGTYQINRNDKKTSIYEFFDYSETANDYVNDYFYLVDTYRDKLNLIHGDAFANSINDLYNLAKDKTGVTTDLKGICVDDILTISLNVDQAASGQMNLSYDVSLVIDNGVISSFSYEKARSVNDGSNETKLVAEGYNYSFSIEENLNSFGSDNILNVQDFSVINKK